MGLIGREIVQARTYVDPTAPAPPKLNYKYDYPITLLEAVKENINDADKENARNLKDILEEIYAELRSKQPIFPAFSANNLLTFAGEAGIVAPIPITTSISWDPKKWSNSKIPTEKAVGELLYKLGFIDEEGNFIDPERDKIRWSDIIGRPFAYEGLGDNDNGFITQKGVTDEIKSLKTLMLDNNDDILGKVSVGLDQLSRHIDRKDNPHSVTIDQIGAASAELFNQHISDVNPHNITAEIIGLGNVNNTADIDKPVSIATQLILNRLQDEINDLAAHTDALDFIVDATYNRKSGKLTIELRHGDTIVIDIPIDDLIDEIRYDKSSKELIVFELNGEETRVDLSDLFIRYIGSVSDSITVEIIGTNETGEQIIKATLNSKGINADALADGSVITRILADRAITGDKISEYTITGINIADNGIITANIADRAITNRKINDRAVNGRTLFSSDNSNRILAVIEKDTDPIWTQVNAEMMGTDSVTARSISKAAVTFDKLADKAVGTLKLEDAAVTTEKIADYSVTHEKLSHESVDGYNIVPNVTLYGTPVLQRTPQSSVNNHEIVDAYWVIRHTDDHVNENKNYADRSVDGRVLFTSSYRHRVLAVLRANTDPVWSLIDNDMMDEDSVGTRNIMNASVTADKIAEKNIYTKHLTPELITEYYLAKDSVTSEKIFESHSSNMVLGVINEGDHPNYTKINKNMMEANSVGTDQVEDRSLPPSKIMPPEDIGYRVLATVLKGSNPVWTQVTNNMIADRAVDGRALFSSSSQDVILGITTREGIPAWIKIYSELLEEKLIKREHISEGAIWPEHLQPGIISSDSIQDGSIETRHIAAEAITGHELFRSQYNNRVLATVQGPFSEPIWTQLNGHMIEDKSIHKEKLFQSEHPYRVIGTTQADVPPEYIMITSDFIVDDSIIPQKLKYNFTLLGTPNMTRPPKDDANNLDIPTTSWVRNTIASMINDFDPTILFDSIYTEMIGDQSITGAKLFRSKYDGPRVLGVTEKGEEPEWMLVENAMIADAAVTEEKLARNMHLLGSPTLDVRPSPFASVANGDGHFIPDCQWVLDRIYDAVTNGTGNSGSSNGNNSSLAQPVADGSVTTEKIQDRAVTARKLFTTTSRNRILAVLEPNSDPQWTRIINDMIEDGAIDSRTLFSSEVDNRILGVVKAGSKPTWMRINHEMLESECIDIDNLREKIITTDKLADRCITRVKFPDVPIIDSILICDNSVITQKILDKAVERSKIANHAVDSTKLDRDLVLKGKTVVDDSEDVESRAVRNSIISHTLPDQSSCGDILFIYE